MKKCTYCGDVKEFECVRGILCHFCNMTLGNAKEDIARLEALVTYLKNYQNIPPVEIL